MSMFYAPILTGSYSASILTCIRIYIYIRFDSNEYSRPGSGSGTGSDSTHPEDDRIQYQMIPGLPMPAVFIHGAGSKLECELTRVPHQALLACSEVVRMPLDS